jgi:hypothetical protein
MDLADSVLHRAAFSTLQAKSAAGSGHTSWSAAWQACLWARLGRGDEAWAALERILNRYTTPRLMSLHPKLQPFESSVQACSTCFSEKIRSHAGADQSGRYTVGRARPISKRRSMVTEDDSIFQADGNSGFTAAVAELLLQTHVSGVVSILPALPSAWLAQGPGEAYGLRGRGDLSVDVEWAPGEKDAKSARILGARLTFGSKHFFHELSHADKGILPIGPRGEALRALSSDCASISSGGRILAFRFPCQVYVCSSGVSDAQCRSHCSGV